MIKTIKNVDDETWHKFKMLAAKDNIEMGNLLKSMIKNYEDKSNNIWKEIFEVEKIITDKEAEILLKRSKEIRKEYGFRK
jgi:hypothetical protein